MSNLRNRIIAFTTAVFLGALSASAVDAPSVCGACAELQKLQAELEVAPKSTTAQRGSKKRTEREEKELSILKTAGTRIAALFQGRTPTAAEVRAATEFLVKSSSRDRTGTALDWVVTSLDGTGAETALREIEKAATDLLQAKIVTPAQIRAFETRLLIQRNASQDEVN